MVFIESPGGRRPGPSVGWLPQAALGATDKGKRGGVRVIYYGVTDAGQIWMLAIYAKTRRENLPAHVIRLIRDKVVKS